MLQNNHGPISYRPISETDPRGEICTSKISMVILHTEADVLYINFKKPGHATDSELAEDDVIIFLFIPDLSRRLS
jgi:hypothetical protein